MLVQYHEHWINQPERGGGRLIGEASHFIDLIRFLVGYEIVSMELVHKLDEKCPDTFSIQIKFKDGSIVVYNISQMGTNHFQRRYI